jgi:3-hydroxyacyl-[acyl-carrier-protein] dehydratase
MRLEYFQMIDRVASREGESILVESRIPDASPVFEGHFPGYPLMPGVLLVETMAQASGWLLLDMMGFARMPFLMAVKEAKFRSFIGPGTPVQVHAKRIHDGSGYAVTEARIEANGKRIADAELTLRIMDFPSAELAEAMRGRGRELGLL